MSLLSRFAAALAAGSVLLVMCSAAHAAGASRLTWIEGLKVAGTPAKYNKVGILEIGPAKARNVLVLNPGTSASAAYFAPLARAVVARAPGWKVWAVERRENLLEDHRVLDAAKAGRATTRDVFDYYLGWVKDQTITTHFQSIPDAQVTYAKRWGMHTAVEDLRRVVLRAKRLGGQVIVGGHSLGGTITTAYATWDFRGKAGADGLAGLVFIDGGSSRTPSTRAAATKSLAELDAGSPWLQFGGIPSPYAGLFNSTGALSVLLDPRGPSLAQASGLLPAGLVPPVPVTNAGLYGYALDTETSPSSLAAAQSHLGHLTPSGDPRGWDDAGELTPLQRMAEAFGGQDLQGLDGTAWYHPLRLTIDAGAVAAGNANPAQKVLGVRAVHGDDLPRRIRIYTFAAGLFGTRALDAAKVLARQSRIPAKNLTLVDRHSSYAHNDPATAEPSRNDFLKRLVAFLKRTPVADAPRP
jgi:hypothetical protein